MLVSVKYHDADMPRLQHTERGDWVDLNVVNVFNHTSYVSGQERFTPAFFRDDLQQPGWELCAHAFYLLSFGVSMELPEFMEAHVLPRSSTYKNYGLTAANSMGLIDNAYCGDGDVWLLPVRSHHIAFLPQYARVAQFRLQWRMPHLEFKEVASLGNADRGGHGSSGT